jgi:predicted O-methyltransferase YrrM
MPAVDQPPLALQPNKLDDRSYAPTYDFGAPDLGERHRGAEESVRDVPGWMVPEDAMKLYELAYFAPGPILEIGAFHGKSAILMSKAARDGATGATVLSVDVDAQALNAARTQAAAHGVTDGIVFFRGSVGALLRTASGLRPGLVFIDGDHSRAGVLSDLEALRPRVPDGALLLFHDYYRTPEMSVPDAVEESWVPAECDFGGAFGSCGLFVRRRGGPPIEPGPPVLDLLSRDSLHMRYLQRVRRPVGRVARRIAGRPRGQD